MFPEMKGLKVLHLIDSGGLYGAEKMLLALVKEQIRQGLDPMILSAGEHGIGQKPLEIEAKRLNLPVIPFRMKPGINIRQSWKILKWARVENYQLLHSHGFKFNVLLGVFPRTISRIPIVSTLHGYVHAPRFSRLWLYQSVDRFVIRRIRGVVLVGEAMKNVLPVALWSGHTEVIPNGLNILELEESSRVLLGEPFKTFFKNHEPVILGVGRLSLEKGFDKLILAFYEVKRKYPSAGLVIVGEGRMRHQFEELVRELDIEDDFLMPGYCNTVAALLRKTNVLVMPSLTEGLPITLLEAMLLKTPIVASAVGEMPKLLGDGDGGEILSNVDPITISSAIEKSLASKGISNQKADWSYKTVNDHYSAEEMSSRYVKFYDRILKNR